MSKALWSLAIVAFVATSLSSASAEDGPKPKGVPDKNAEGEIARYCGAIAPSAAEARLNYQIKRLSELDARVRQELDELKEREAEARQWVLKRQDLGKAANEDVTAIYAKMSAESAAAQLATMDEEVASSILSKLKPQTASSILNEMEAEKAARLTTQMSAGPAQEKKS